MKKLTQAILVASAATAGMMGVSQAAHAEVSASVGIANTYVFRGLDMGSGTPAVSGALDYGHSSGAYAGVWATSGDDAGDEYNVYVGFGGEAGDFTYDINYLAYLYPEAESMGLDDFGEVTVGLGYKALSAFVSVPVTSDQSGTYTYFNVSYAVDAFGIALGHNAGDEDEGVETYTHVDLSYQYNDNLSFMVTKIVDSDVDGRNQEPRFVVSYSLPISL